MPPPLTPAARRRTFPIAGLTLAALVTLLGCLTPAAAQPEPEANPDPDPQALATRLVLDAAAGDNPLLRMNALEASQHLPQQAEPLVRAGLDDPNPAVRWAALITLGRLNLDALAPRASQLAQDPAQETYVRAAAAFAAHRTGHDADLGLIAQLLWDPRPGQRANAALLLSMLDEPSAIPMLRDAAQDPMTRSPKLKRELFRLQAAEALVQLGDLESLKVVRGAVYSSEQELRVLAIIILGRCADQGMTGNLIRLLAQDPVELRLAAAAALASMGSNEGLPVMLEAAATSTFSTVRAQAANGLGQAADDPRARQALASLLQDPDAAVRLSAAAAWLAADHR